MPLITSCPDCEKKLRVPDDLMGKKVKCPKCGVMFTANPAGETQRVRSKGGSTEDRISSGPKPKSRPSFPEHEEERPSRSGIREELDSIGKSRPAPGPAPEDDDDDDYPPQEGGKKANVREGWKKVRLGLTLVAIAGWTVLASLAIAILGGSLIGLLMALGVASAASGAATRNPGGANTALGLFAGMGIMVLLVAGLVFLLNLAATVLTGVGTGFCLATPQKRDSAARGLGITSFALFIAAVVLYLANFALQCLGGMGRIPALSLMGSCSNIFSGLCFLAWFIVFLFYLRSVALAMRSPAAASTVVNHLIAWAVYVAVCFLSVCLIVGLTFAGIASVANSSGKSVSGLLAANAVSVIIAVILLIGYICLFIWWVLIVQQVRGLVDQRGVHRPSRRL